MSGSVKRLDMTLSLGHNPSYGLLRPVYDKNLKETCDRRTTIVRNLKLVDWSQQVLDMINKLYDQSRIFQNVRCTCVRREFVLRASYDDRTFFMFFAMDLSLWRSCVKRTTDLRLSCVFHTFYTITLRTSTILTTVVRESRVWRTDDVRTSQVCLASSSIFTRLPGKSAAQIVQSLFGSVTINMPKNQTSTKGKGRGKGKGRELREADERQEREREEREMREREKNGDNCEDQIRGPSEREDMCREEETDNGEESTSSTGKRVAKTISFSFSSADEERLVDFFREHECFYNKTLNSYSNAVLKKKLVEGVANELKTTSEYFYFYSIFFIILTPQNYKW